VGQFEKVAPYPNINDLQLQTDMHPRSKILFVGARKDDVRELHKRRSNLFDLLAVVDDGFVGNLLVVMEPLNIEVGIVALLKPFQHGQVVSEERKKVGQLWAVEGGGGLVQAFAEDAGLDVQEGVLGEAGGVGKEDGFGLDAIVVETISDSLYSKSKHLSTLI